MQIIRKHGLLIIILLVMLGFRLYIWRHTTVYLYGDMYRYDIMARHLLLNGYMGIGSTPDAYYTPGYSLFLALIYKLSMWLHGGLLLPIVRTSHEVFFVQQIFSVVNILLVYMLGNLLKNRVTGLAAAIIAAFYLPNSFVGELLLSENMFIPFLLLIMVVVLYSLQKKRTWLFVLAGIVIGLATLVRPFVLPLLFLFIMAIFWQSFRERRQNSGMLKQGVRFSLALGGGTVLALLPWWIRNYLDFHHFVPLSTEAGNPLLAGAYPYFQVPFDQLAKTAQSLHLSQESYAIHLILQGFSHHFFLYLGWFLFGKLYYLFWSPWLYNYVDWLVIYHRVLVVLGGVAVFVGLSFQKTRFFAVTILFLLAMQLVFLPLYRYGYPLLVLMGVLLPAVIANLSRLLRRGTAGAEK